MLHVCTLFLNVACVCALLCVVQVLSMCARAASTSATHDVLPRRECVPFLTWFWANLAIDLAFIIDIAVNLRTGYTVEGHFVNDDVLAAKHYLKGTFVLDAVGSFPINLLFIADTFADDSSANGGGAGGSSSGSYGRSNKILRLLRVAKLAKLLRMLKLGSYLEDFGAIIRFNPGLLRVFKLVGVSLLCCHW